MPRDTVFLEPNPDPGIDLSRPSARGLSYLLRHEELWPHGFTWDFNLLKSCAIGLASQTWGLGITWRDAHKVLTGTFGFDTNSARRIFEFGPESLPACEVANRIDDYLNQCAIAGQIDTYLCRHA